MFKIIISGVLIGIANIIPGVSGATLAVLTNQYERIMAVCNSGVSLKFKDVDWVYLLTIGLAAGMGIYLFSWPLDYGLTYYNAYTMVMIIGLILGSLNGVRMSNQSRSNASRFLNPFFGLGCLVVASLIFIDPAVKETTTVSVAALIISGVVAMIAMIIPGVSGSLMLILLGTYASIIRLIKQVDLFELVPFVGGVFIGGIIGIKLVKWIIEYYTSAFESFILGAVVGSTIYMIVNVNILDANIWALNLLLVLGIVIGLKLVTRESR
ncbi:MAG: DUF368 domain-containing protein [Candidatus Margulisiibacteriota bacterium]